MKAVFDRTCARCLRRLPDEQIAAAHAAMQAAAGTFGQPHLHTGRGIREIKPGLYECRSGLGLRLLFRREGENLHFLFAGNHDEIRTYLRNRR